MPEIQLKHVVSCSSEDRNNPADNLLKAEGTHKWRTAATGEKNATIVLQFEKACHISGLDIGNEGSAFVEVLVGKATSSDSDYQVLLVSSSFMSPADSRSGSNRNSVRMFGADKLSKTVLSEKWDRVKIVCTQPFNKSTTYGLSFIKFHTGSDSSRPAQKEGMKKLGAFSLKRDDEDEEDDIKVGALFANKGKKEATTTPPPLTGAAAVRAASRLAEEAHASRPSTSRAAQAQGASSRTPNPTTTTTTTPTPRRTLASAAAASKASPKKHAVSDEDHDTEDEAPPPKVSLKRQSTSLSSVASSRSAEAPPPLKKMKTEPAKPSPAKEFGRLMERATFVLSGFQNPFRGELRERGLEMGACYKPDWGKGCTHLVCAFTNTPKYNQVKGRGRIVSKQWINDCYKQKKLLPWRKYRLGDAESPGGSSEEEEEITLPKKAPPPPKRASSASSAKESTSATPKPTKPKAAVESDEEMYGGNTDSAEDTDEEIRRATEKARPKKEQPPARSPEGKGKAGVKGKAQVKVTKPEVKVTKPEVKVTKPDPALAIFADSTDEDEPGRNNTAVAMDTDEEGGSGLPDLPDFFADKHFFFYGSFDSAEKRLLTRYIAAYDGVLEDYMTDRVKFVVTATSWDDNFDEAVSENPSLVFVKPEWIRNCHNSSKLVACKPYTVVP
ncbi:hypothetical protein ACOMHN_044543 [Nucella lapillus]